MGSAFTFPTATLYLPGGETQQVPFLGRAAAGKVLLAYRVPMTEKHLDAGVLGTSKVALVDDKGQPKRIIRNQVANYCLQHMTAWFSSDFNGCPECAKNNPQN